LKISKNTSLKKLAILVCDHLKKNGIEAVLSGGAVVTIYSKQLYQSYDLDFITLSDRKKIAEAMQELGFIKDKGRYYKHPYTKFFIEFPPGPLAIGEEIIKSYAIHKTSLGTLFLLTPTQCVMDRLCAFYFWNDYQALAQALLVAKNQKVNIHKIKLWSYREGMKDRFGIFLKKLQESMQKNSK